MLGQDITEIKKFGPNPGSLKMFLHLPPASMNHQAKPLVVVLHGCLQDAKTVSEQTGWNKIADANDFIVVYPQQQFLNNPDYCFCWYRSRDINRGAGEDASIKDMIDYAKSNYPIDSTRIFITGLSAGAAMGVVLMSTYPEIFNAGAIFAGGPYKGAENAFSAFSLLAGKIEMSPESWADKVRQQNLDFKGSYPRMIIYQGENDHVVNKKNAVELLKQWTTLLHTSKLPDRSLDRFANNPDIQKDIYLDQHLKEAILYYHIKGLGHALLIHPGSCPNEGGKRLAFSEDRNYHSTWWTAIDFGLVKVPEIQGQTEVSKGERNLVYTVPEHPKSSYNWSLPPGTELQSGAGSHSIILGWGQAGGSVNVSETDSAGCLFQYPSLFVGLKNSN
jgi:feruloyl esterase